jgi:hypothetical protein
VLDFLHTFADRCHHAKEEPPVPDAGSVASGVRPGRPGSYCMKARAGADGRRDDGGGGGSSGGG